MMIEFRRIEYKGKFVNISENAGLVFGFTEQGFELRNLGKYLKVERIYELKQVHSNIIHFAGRIEPGTEGDGIILDQKNSLAIIKTADCVPLFFWSKNYSAAGIIHVGWQGLYKGIEKRLLELLEKVSVTIGDLCFFMGPAIERDCYEVGRDLYDKFSGKSYRDEIFFKKNKEKYLMDIKKGIVLSLKELGIRDKQIMISNFCTFCEKDRFPSYRRDRKTGSRIYNFLYLKPGLR